MSDTSDEVCAEANAGDSRVSGSELEFADRRRATALAVYRNVLDSKLVLVDLLRRAGYGSVEQAIGSLTLFSHPNTVRQTRGLNLFRVIRRSSDRSEHGGRMRGDVIDSEHGPVMLDDNDSPKRAFLWANGFTKAPARVQFNHVWGGNNGEARCVSHYTSLANIVVTPAFLARETDDEDIRQLLKYRAYDLYRENVPLGVTPPEKPVNYDAIEWVAPLDPVDDVRLLLEQRLHRSPRSRAARSVSMLGWMFSGSSPGVPV